MELKPHFREVNQELSILLKKHQKPALIVHSNLLGEQQLLLFKNQLRFWDEDIDLMGIVLNSLYCELSLADTSTYFALGHNDDFQSFLQNYLHP